MGFCEEEKEFENLCLFSQKKLVQKKLHQTSKVFDRQGKIDQLLKERGEVFEERSNEEKKKLGKTETCLVYPGPNSPIVTRIGRTP